MGLSRDHQQRHEQVHERTVDSDFLIIILRDLALQRKDLTLVLMSATLNADVSEVTHWPRCVRGCLVALPPPCARRL